MKLIDNGSMVTVEFEHWDVHCFANAYREAFRISFSGHGQSVDGEGGDGWYQFDKKSGDLIDMGGDAIENNTDEFFQQFYGSFSQYCGAFAAMKLAYVNPKRIVSLPQWMHALIVREAA